MQYYLKPSIEFFKIHFCFLLQSQTVEDILYPTTLMGKHAPYFRGKAVINEEFEDISLDQYAGKYLLLLFYPMDL